MEEYYIKSIWAAAHLLSRGFKFLRVGKLPTGRKIYYFENSDGIIPALNEYYDNDELQKYVENCIVLRNKIYDDRE